LLKGELQRLGYVFEEQIILGQRLFVSMLAPVIPLGNRRVSGDGLGGFQGLDHRTHDAIELGHQDCDRLLG
jgi:hypothetical protein